MDINRQKEEKLLIGKIFNQLRELIYGKTSLNNDDNFFISLGLFYFIHEISQRPNGIKKIEELKKYSYERTEMVEDLLFNLGDSNPVLKDISSYFLKLLEKIGNYQLRELINVASEIIYIEISQENLLATIRDIVIKTEGSYNKGQFYYSNPQLIELLKLIVKVHPDDVIYDPASGLGLLLSFLNKQKFSTIIFQDKSERLINFSKLFSQFIQLDGKKHFSLKSSLEFPAIDEEQADLIILEPPFGNRINSDEIAQSFRHFSKDSTELFIRLSLTRLKPNGRAFILVPEGILGNPVQSKLRQDLVKNNNVEAIISFPNRFLAPFSGVKTSLLILNKEQYKNPNKKILFIESEIQNEALKRGGAPKINIQKIADTYWNKSQPTGDNYIWVSEKEIERKQYDLQAKRYLNDLKLKHSLRPNDTLVKIKNLVFNVSTPRNETDNIPYIKVGNLAKDLYDISLNLNNWQVQDDDKKGRFLQESALLLARVGGKLKPSYFKYEGSPISINPNVIALKIKEEFLDKEYLIYELASNFIKLQLDTIQSGSVIPAWSKKKLLELFIRVPYYKKKESIKAQKEIVSKKKNNLLESKKEEFDALKRKFQIEDKGLEIISNFKHDFMGNLERISSGLSVLDNFLREKDQNEGILKVSEQIIAEDPVTLGEWMDTLRLNVENSISRLANEVEQIKEDREIFNFKVINLLQLLKKIKKEFPVTKRYKIRIEKDLEVDNNDGLKAKVDEDQFQKAMQNLISNAIEHGFGDKKNKSYEIVFEVGLIKIEDNSFVRIVYKNDGKGFEEGFTFHDFVQRGKRAGENGKTGIGGDRIKRIIEKHNGFFSEILQKSEDALLNPFKINFEILIPQHIE